MAEILAASDRSVLVRFGAEMSPEYHRAVCGLMRAFERKPVAGVTSISPGFASVLFRYDPRLLSPRDAEHAVELLLDHEDSAALGGRAVEVPVCYGGEYGPDLDELAQWAGLSPDAVVELHCAEEYHVYFLGFAPGFAYLGEVDPRIAMPRRAKPRPRVPRGSVGIAARQTAVYPSATPGGWNLIGRCPLALFSTAPECKTLLQTGDTVRFRPIDGAEFARIAEGIPPA